MAAPVGMGCIDMIIVNDTDRSRAQQVVDNFANHHSRSCSAATVTQHAAIHSLALAAFVLMATESCRAGARWAVSSYTFSAAASNLIGECCEFP